MLRELSVRLVTLSSALALGAAACAAEPPPWPVAAKPAPPKPAAVAAAPPGHASRFAVERALSAGPPWLLRRVMRESALTKDGKFIGWRITGLPEEWSDIDLHPGDVVSRVNNHPLETPDDAWEAWKSVGRAREVRVRIDRGGISREVVIPIDGEPTAAVVRALESDTPPPRTPAAGKPKSVTSLGVDAPPGEDTGEWESY